MLGSLNNWNIIQFTNKTISSEEFDDIHKVLLDGISGNILVPEKNIHFSQIVLLDIRKAYDNLDCGRILKTLER